MAKATRLGKNRVEMTLQEEIFSLIHNIVVVTSPIGVQAPPALAAMTAKQSGTNLSFFSGINLRMMEIIKIIVVRLSKIAERKKVMQDDSINNSGLDLVLKNLWTTSKPL